MANDTGNATESKDSKVETVSMKDGRLVDFAGKRKLLKDTFIEGSDVTIRLDFRNGETRTFKIPQELMLKFAGHGAEQKLGDEIAGVDDVEDCVLAVDDLMTRLDNKEWSTKSAGNGMAGTSILVRALMEFTGKTLEQIRAFLSSKNQAEKIALRNNPKVKPIVERLESEKAAKMAGAAKVDTDAMLATIGA